MPRQSQLFFPDDPQCVIQRGKGLAACFCASPDDCDLSACDERYRAIPDMVKSCAIFRGLNHERVPGTRRFKVQIEAMTHDRAMRGAPGREWRR